MSVFVNYAHRGASAYAPENTMSSFRKALDIGSNGIELDLQKTKDNKIVIFHDDTIDRKSDGTGKISDYTYNELLKYDFGSWFDDKFKDEKIVLFEDFMKEMQGRDFVLAIELKEENIENPVLEIINKYYDINKVYITSFLYSALQNVRKLSNNIKIGWLIREDINENNINKLKQIQGNQICPPADLISKDGIKIARDNNLSIRLWRVSTIEIMKRSYILDIDGMTVNFPDELKKLMEKDKKN